MSSDNKKKELINDIELEMKSNNITNSDIISIDEIQKKEIISENGKDSFTEIKFIKNENNIDTKESSLKENPKESYGDLTSIIQNKIKTRNLLEKNKKKNGRALSASSMMSTKEKNKKLKLNLTTSNAKNSQMTSYSKNKKTKESLSLPKKINKINNNSKTIKKPIKKNPQLFINKPNANNNNNKKILNGNLTTKRNKKNTFDNVLKRFDQEKETANKRFENKKKELKDKEKTIYTGKPKINKNKGNKYEKFTKDFLTRQKEATDNLNKKKKKLMEEENKKKEKEYQKIISESILTKKMKKYKKNKSDDLWVQRLYKEDPKKRQFEREALQSAFKPSFQPYLPKKRHLNTNKSMDRINQIEKVLDKYNERHNPQLIIDYLSKNKLDESESLFREKIFKNFVKKNKKMNNSMDANMEMDEDDD